MTQDEIIDMARQVGIEAESDTLCRFGGWVEPFVAFANLVAAKALTQTQEPVGHRDGYWCADLTCKKCYSADFRFKHKNSVDKESLTTPPQRTWVGLDHQDKKKFSSWLDHKTDDEVFTAIDDLLREMNT